MIAALSLIARVSVQSVTLFSDLGDKEIQELLSHFRKMESLSHREALEEAARRKGRGGKVRVYTGNRGMKIMLSEEQKEDDNGGGGAWGSRGGGGGGGGPDDEMGDEYF